MHCNVTPQLLTPNGSNMTHNNPSWLIMARDDIPGVRGVPRGDWYLVRRRTILSRPEPQNKFFRTKTQSFEIAWHLDIRIVWPPLFHLCTHPSLYGQSQGNSHSHHCFSHQCYLPLSLSNLSPCTFPFLGRDPQMPKLQLCYGTLQGQNWMIKSSVLFMFHHCNNTEINTVIKKWVCHKNRYYL